VTNGKTSTACIFQHTTIPNAADAINRRIRAIISPPSVLCKKGHGNDRTENRDADSNFTKLKILGAFRLVHESYNSAPTRLRNNEPQVKTMPLLSNRNMNGARRFRELLSSSDVIQAPGAYDCLTARLIEAAGFPIVYMTGFGTSASYLGRPDVGLLGMTEMVDNARRIVDAVSVPVIADADTGYGNAINVIRTVQAYEHAGVAAIHIEDQLAPKKCGHLEGKRLIPAAEMVQKICAAIDARNFSDFAIIARTDARAVEGLDCALERASIPRSWGGHSVCRGTRKRTRNRNDRQDSPWNTLAV
jgi:Phosphoenolpyruvate phosphomutase